MAVELGAAIAEGRDPDSQEQARINTAAALDTATRASVIDDLEPKLDFGAFRRLLPRAEAVPWRTLAFIYGFLGYAAATLVALSLDFPLAAAMSALLVAISTFLVIGSGQIISVRTSRQSLAPATEALAVGAELRRLIRRPDEGAPPVLLIVDNLDRLGGNEAMSVLSDIRAFVDDPDSRCIFLIPIDRAAFARSVKVQVGTEIAARDYLEKFFNLDLLLTRPAGLDLRSWTRDLISQVFPDHPGDDRTTAAEVIATAAAGSPRAAKRMVNGISARYWLIQPNERTLFTLAQLSVVEALIAQFPYAGAVAARDARTLTEGRESLHSATDGEGRMSAIAGLLPPNGEHDAQLNVALRDLLLLADPIPLTVADVQTVLSLREDRALRGVSNAPAVRAAIRAGQPDEFGAAIAGLGDDERTLAVDRGVEIAEDDLAKGFKASAVNAVNALAPFARGVARDRLWKAATEALLASAPAVYRTLMSGSIELIFDPKRTDRRVEVLANRAVDELAANPTGGPNESLIRAISAAAPRLSTAVRDKARTALSLVPDDELDALFDPAPNSMLIPGAVAEKLISQLADWSPTAGMHDTLRGVERTRAAVQANLIEAEALAPIAPPVQSHLPSVSHESIPTLEVIVGLLAVAAPDPKIDALGQTLSAWGFDSEVGLCLAAGLPLSPAALTPVVSQADSFMRSQPIEAVTRVLATRREQLLAMGADLATPLVRRWVGGEGQAFLDLAVVDDTPAAWSVVRTYLADAPVDRFVSLMAEAADAARARRSGSETSNSLRDLLVGRLSVLTPSQLQGVGNVMGLLSDAGCDVEEAINELVSRVGSAGSGEIVDWTARVEELVTAVEQFGPQLVAALTVRCAALGELDLSRTGWLLEHGADVEGIRTAVLAEIASGRHTAQDLTAALTPLRRPLGYRWQIREALVIRGLKTGSTESARPHLEEARAWKAPPKTKREAYDEALDGLAAMGGLDDLVADLRK